MPPKRGGRSDRHATTSSAATIATNGQPKPTAAKSSSSPLAAADDEEEQTEGQVQVESPSRAAAGPPSKLKSKGKAAAAPPSSPQASSDRPSSIEVSNHKHVTPQELVAATRSVLAAKRRLARMVARERKKALWRLYSLVKPIVAGEEVEVGLVGDGVEPGANDDDDQSETEKQSLRGQGDGDNDNNDEAWQLFQQEHPLVVSGDRSYIDDLDLDGTNKGIDVQSDVVEGTNVVPPAANSSHHASSKIALPDASHLRLTRAVAVKETGRQDTADGDAKDDEQNADKVSGTDPHAEPSGKFAADADQAVEESRMHTTNDEGRAEAEVEAAVKTMATVTAGDVRGTDGTNVNEHIKPIAAEGAEVEVKGKTAADTSSKLVQAEDVDAGAADDDVEMSDVTALPVVDGGEESSALSVASTSAPETLHPEEASSSPSAAPPTADPLDVIPPTIIPEAFRPRRPVYVPRILLQHRPDHDQREDDELGLSTSYHASSAVAGGGPPSKRARTRRTWIGDMRAFDPYQPEHLPAMFPPAASGLLDWREDEEVVYAPTADGSAQQQDGGDPVGGSQQQKTRIMPLENAFAHSLQPLPVAASTSLTSRHHHGSKRSAQEAANAGNVEGNVASARGNSAATSGGPTLSGPFLEPLSAYDIQLTGSHAKHNASGKVPSLRNRTRSMLLTGYGLPSPYASERGEIASAESAPSSAPANAAATPALTGTLVPAAITTAADEIAPAAPPTDGGEQHHAHHHHSIYDTGFQYAANPVSRMISRSNKCVTSRDWRTVWQEIKFNRALERVEQLKSEQRWSFRQLKKQKGPQVGRSHWDWLLEEAKWLQVDFREERRWKMATAYNLAREVQRWHSASLDEKAAMSVTRKPWGTARDDSAAAGAEETNEADQVMQQIKDNQHDIEAAEASLQQTEVKIEDGSKTTSVDGDADADGEEDDGGSDVDMDAPAVDEVLKSDEPVAALSAPIASNVGHEGPATTLLQDDREAMFDALALEIRKPLLNPDNTDSLVDIAGLVAAELGVESDEAMQASLSDLFPDLAMYGLPETIKQERRIDETSGRLAHTSRLTDIKPAFVSALEPGRYHRSDGWYDIRDEDPLQLRLSIEDSRATSPQPQAPLFAGKKGRPHLDLPGRRPPEQPRNHLMRSVLVQWDETDDALLERLILEYPSNWDLIADVFNSARGTIPTDKRTAWDCYERWDKKFGPSSQQQPEPAPTAAAGVLTATTSVTPGNVPGTAVSAPSAAAPTMATAAPVNPATGPVAAGSTPAPAAGPETTTSGDGREQEEAPVQPKSSKHAKYEGSRKKVRLVSLRDSIRRLGKRRDNANKKQGEQKRMSLRVPCPVANFSELLLAAPKNVVNVHESHNQFLERRIPQTPQELSQMHYESILLQQAQLAEAQRRAAAMRLQMQQQQAQQAAMPQPPPPKMPVPMQQLPPQVRPPNSAGLGSPSINGQPQQPMSAGIRGPSTPGGTQQLTQQQLLAVQAMAAQRAQAVMNGQQLKLPNGRPPTRPGPVAPGAAAAASAAAGGRPLVPQGVAQGSPRPGSAQGVPPRPNSAAGGKLQVGQSPQTPRNVMPNQQSAAIINGLLNNMPRPANSANMTPEQIRQFQVVSRLEAGRSK